MVHITHHPSHPFDIIVWSKFTKLAIQNIYGRIINNKRKRAFYTHTNTIYRHACLLGILVYLLGILVYFLLVNFSCQKLVESSKIYNLLLLQ